jgi:hypothetical protein
VTPDWLTALQPCAQPEFRPIVDGSVISVWHVAVAFDVWPVPPGRTLAGSDSWNGKALVVPAYASIERSVGEVELAERLRRLTRAPKAYWTAGKGGGPPIWHPWILKPKLREPWFRDLDDKIRRLGGNDLILNNAKGLPDVVCWGSGASDICFVEYKGPAPGNPTRMDAVNPQQEAWARGAIAAGIDPSRFAVACWTPSPTQRHALRAQYDAHEKRRQLTS